MSARGSTRHISFGRVGQDHSPRPRGYAMQDGLVLVPFALRASHAKYFGNDTEAWIQALPDLVDRWRDEWQLRLDGAPQSGAVALVVPVVRADGTPAVLKLQPVDEETRGEPIALAWWAGNAAVRLLERDPASGSMLLERLDATRSLASVPEPRAISVIAGLLLRLNRLPAPESMRLLDDIARSEEHTSELQSPDHLVCRLLLEKKKKKKKPKISRKKKKTKRKNIH